MTEVSSEAESFAPVPDPLSDQSVTDGMRPPGSQLPLRGYLGQLWHLRHYTIAVAKARVESANVNTSLGKFWLIGEPILFIAVYGLIFGVILGATRGTDNFIGFLASGQILFRHNSRGMQSAGTAMTAFERQIQTMPVPRALFPISSVATTFLTLVPAVIVMCAILLLTGESVGLAWLFIVPILAGQVLLNIGIGSVFARAVAHIPDLNHVLTHLFRSALYFSGAVFPIAIFIGDRDNGPFLVKILTIFNPLFDYLELGRWALMDMRPMFPGLTILSALTWSLITPVIGILWLRRAERRYGFGQIRNAP